MREESIDIRSMGSRIPATLYHPGDDVRAVVLMGHGLGVDRYHESNRIPAELLVQKGCAVLAPDLPLHGERQIQAPADPTAMVDAWQVYWSQGGVQALRAEWLDIQTHAVTRFPSLPIGYFGISLATQYGIVLLAGNSLVRAAVLGLFGSHPPPRTPVMNRNAPLVTCPITFLKQTDDEIHPSASVDHLFNTLGSEQKRLLENPGRHTDITHSTFARATAFLVDRLDAR